jgi:hypothetical protein
MTLVTKCRSAPGVSDDSLWRLIARTNRERHSKSPPIDVNLLLGFASP